MISVDAWLRVFSQSSSGSGCYIPGLHTAWSSLGADMRRRKFIMLLGGAAADLIVPNALTAPAFVHAKGFASARVKHYLNDVGPITAANALELFLSFFAGQLACTKKVHVTLLMGIQ